MQTVLFATAPAGFWNKNGEPVPEAAVVSSHAVDVPSGAVWLPVGAFNDAVLQVVSKSCDCKSRFSELRLF